MLVLGTVLLLAWFVLSQIKSKINVSYDYCFVNGELRISRVYNVNKRKSLAVIGCEEIVKLGDVDSASFERLKADVTIKMAICTPNVAPMDEKFFLYVLVNRGEKTLFVLECRENLLMNILKFVRRGTLAEDYVMQEKKTK